MHSPFATMRRLHDRGARSRGLVVDADGVTLGPDCVLVRRTPAGYRCADPDDLTRLARTVFASDPRLTRLPIVLAGIAKALDRGDLVMAQLLGLELPVGDLDDNALRRLHAISDLSKDFDPDQLRDERGRWTNGGGTTVLTTATAAAGAAALAADAITWLEETTRDVAVMGNAAVLAVGMVVVPFGRSNVAEGTLPEAPDITYRYDEGVLTLSYRGTDGQVTTLFNGLSVGGLYRDEDGHVIGRNLGDGKGFVLDPDALPVLAAKAKAKDRIDPNAVEASLSRLVEAARREPRLCPDPTKENGGPTSVQAALYQWQVCGTPPGYGIEYNGVNFDGCDPHTGILEECKALGFADKLSGPDEFEDWYRGADNAPNQMRKQSIAAGDRLVIWHVAEPEFADLLGRIALQYPNIRVIHTPPPPPNPEFLRRFAASWFGLAGEYRV